MIRRWHLLSTVIKKNKWKFGIEIGVLYGQNLAYLLRENSNLTMVGIDSWIATEEYSDQEIMNEYKASAYLLRDLYVGRLHLINASSRIAHTLIPDHYADFVFIDADHSYCAVKNDIKNYLPKVKENGWLCGHDYGRTSVRNALDKTLENVKYTGIDGVWYIEV